MELDNIFMKKQDNFQMKSIEIEEKCERDMRTLELLKKNASEIL